MEKTEFREVNPDRVSSEIPVTKLFQKGLTMSDIPLFPVAGWMVGPIPRLGLATIKFDFVTNALQRPEEANEGRHYALTPLQLRELIEKMQSALDVLESAGEQAPEGQRH